MKLCIVQNYAISMRRHILFIFHFTNRLPLLFYCVLLSALHTFKHYKFLDLFDIRLERNLTQTLRQQQDEAYEQSLRADQEKERLKQLEAQKIIQQQLDEEAELVAEQQRKEVINIKSGYTQSNMIIILI